MLKYIFLIIILCFTKNALFCLCREDRSAYEIIEQFRREKGVMIFLGKLIYGGADSTIILRNGIHPTVYIFKIEESWIGLDTIVTEIKLFQEGGNDFIFRKDSTYLVFSRDLEPFRSMTPFYLTSGCLHNSLFSAATEELKILGLSKKHRAVKKENDGTNDFEVHNQLYFLITSILINIFLLIFIMKRWMKFN